MPALLSVPIFFIIFRETVEAGIIVSVLLSFVEQLMTTGHLAGTQLSPTKALRSSDRASFDSDATAERAPSRESTESAALLAEPSGSGEGRLSGDSDSELTARPTIGEHGTHGMTEDERDQVRILVRRMKTQIWAGTLAGLAVATAIGAAFIVIFYVKLVDIWASTEQLWEGAFSLLASILILIMGIAFLRMDRARVKWRYKLSLAFERSHRRLMRARAMQAGEAVGDENADEREGEGGKWALFLLPFVTVLREGLEAVLFVSGVALSVEPSAIPLATLAGLILGIIVGLAIYRTGSTTTLHYFLIASTSLLFLIGAGLASKGVGFLEYYVFATAVGGDVAETGDGPGSFRVGGNIWHFECCNPEPGSASTNGFWQLANSLVGWNNTATYGSVGAYIGYWLLVAAVLMRLKWKEGRMSLFGQVKGRRIALQGTSGR